MYKKNPLNMNKGRKVREIKCISQMFEISFGFRDALQKHLTFRAGESEKWKFFL